MFKLGDVVQVRFKDGKIFGYGVVIQEDGVIGANRGDLYAVQFREYRKNESGQDTDFTYTMYFKEEQLRSIEQALKQEYYNGYAKGVEDSIRITNKELGVKNE